MGRDPAIENAKTLLVERFGISRGAAFVILRRASSLRNEKLASVGRGFLNDDADRVA